MVGCVQATCTAADAAEIDGFDYSKFENEDAGTPALVEYHKQQLQSCGLSMERGGYSVLDMHETAVYSVQIGPIKYSGGVDGGVVPFAIRQGSAAKLLRIGFVHKQSSEDKAAFQANNPSETQVEYIPSACDSDHVKCNIQLAQVCNYQHALHPQTYMQADVGAATPYDFEEGRPQAVCCLLAAHAMTQCPMDVDVTDGKQHHLLRLRGEHLLVYEGCSPKQVFFTLALCQIMQASVNIRWTCLVQLLGIRGLQSLCLLLLSSLVVLL